MPKNIRDGCDELNRMLAEVEKAAISSTDDKMGEAADYLKERLAENTPIDTGLTKNSWVSENKYHLVKFVNNTRLAKNRIPVVNLLEYSRNGKPFARQTFASAEPQIIAIMESTDIGGK